MVQKWATKGPTKVVVFCIEHNSVTLIKSPAPVLPGSCAASTSSVGDNVDAIRETYGNTTVRNSLLLSTSRPETIGFFKRLVDGH